MAFTLANLVKTSSHANADEGQQWSYKEDATVAAIAASGYFNSATNVLRQGDVIVIFGNNGTGICRVSSATGAGTVTVAALSALT